MKTLESNEKQDPFTVCRQARGTVFLSETLLMRKMSGTVVGITVFVTRMKVLDHVVL